VVKETITTPPSNPVIFNEIFILTNRQLPAYQRLMLISSASISSAVVMIFDDAE
jgi:hypothetical protein